MVDIEKKKNTIENSILVSKQQAQQELAKKKNELERFITSFEKETNRLPSKDEIIYNMEDNISLEIISAVLDDIEYKHKDGAYSIV